MHTNQNLWEQGKSFNSIADWMIDLGDSPLSKKIKVASLKGLILLSWEIWIARNKELFEGKSDPFWKIKQKFVDSAEFESSLKKTNLIQFNKERNANTGEKLEDFIGHPQVLIITDGAFKESEDISAATACLFNHNHTLINGRVDQFKAYSALQAEVRGLLLADQLLDREGIGTAMIGTDSKIAVNILSGRALAPW
jgi:hypothetical protein